MSTSAPSRAPGASAVAEAGGAHLTAPHNPYAGAALLTQADAGSPHAARVLPGLVLVGTGIGSAIVSAVAVGQQGVEPRDAGTAGCSDNNT